MDWSLWSIRKNYNVNKEIRIKTPMLRSDLCDFSDAYILVKGDITIAETDNAKGSKIVAFKKSAPFVKWISKISGVRRRINGNAEDLDVVMPMYNLLEYSKNYRKTTGSLWSYYRDEPSNPLSLNSKSFKYKSSIRLEILMMGMMIQKNSVKLKLKFLFR